MNGLKIYVCIKHVPDSAANIVVVGKNRIGEDIPFLINPYDEHALTEAVRIKEERPRSEIIAVCLGPAAAENTLRSAVAMGADRAILAFSGNSHDNIFTALVLKAVIAGDGEPDIILTGKAAIDTEAMQTPFRLAEHFGMPAATNVCSLILRKGVALVECEKEGGGVDLVRMRLPCVVGAGKSLNAPRYPTIPEIVKSRKKAIQIIEVTALDIQKPASRTEIIELNPILENRNPKRLTGSPHEIACHLIAILRKEVGTG